jgi:uncharacterized protein
MQINVSQLLRESIGTSRTYDINEILKDDVFPKHVQGSANLIKTRHGILLIAMIQTEVEESCIRCLKTVSFPVNFVIEEEVFPRNVAYDTASSERDNLIIDNNNILDLDEMLRQYIELNKPFKPICDPTCKGVQLEIDDK